MSVIESVRRILEDYEMGEPWKLSKGVGFVVPILGRPPFPDRNYVLLQEVLDEVEFTDTGHIGGVNVRNQSGQPVYIRKGTILKGTTQPRSPVSGYVAEPIEIEVTIPVNCIHASQGITRGLKFQARGLTPHGVYSSLGDQNLTWQTARSSVEQFRAGGSAAMFMGAAALDSMSRINRNDLAEAMDRVEEIKGTVEDVLAGIPGDHINQIGIAVFDLEGVVAVELFDHPDSWKAFSDSVTRSYAEILTKTSDLVEIKMDRAVVVLREFLSKALEATKTMITMNSISKVFSLEVDKIVGELVTVNDKEIHMVLCRSAERRQPQRLRALFAGIPREQQERRIVTGTYTDEDTHIYTAMMHSPDWYRRQGSLDLLQKLDKKPSRFTELLSDMDVSRGTLGSRIREAKDMGLIHKTIRPDNGYTVWNLTALGKETKKESVRGRAVR